MWRRVNVLPNPTPCVFSFQMNLIFLSPSMLNSHPLGEEPSCFLILPCRVLPQVLILLGL